MYFEPFNWLWDAPVWSKAANVCERYRWYEAKDRFRAKAPHIFTGSSWCIYFIVHKLWLTWKGGKWPMNEFYTRSSSSQDQNLTKTSDAFDCTDQSVPLRYHGPCILDCIGCSITPNIQFRHFNDLFSLLSVGGVPAVLQLGQKSRSVDLQSSVRLRSWSSLSIRNSFNFTSYYTAPPCDSNNFYFETFERSKNQHSSKTETILVLFGTPLDGKKSQAKKTSFENN